MIMSQVLMRQACDYRQDVEEYGSEIPTHTLGGLPHPLASNDQCEQFAASMSRSEGRHNS